MKPTCLADDLRAQRVRRHRGHLEGVLDPAHAADVRSQRDPRRDPASARSSSPASPTRPSPSIVGLVAIVLATVNMVGGFVVTDRMLQMFSGRKPRSRAHDAVPGRRACSTWSRPSASSSRSRACRRRSTARNGNLLGAVGAVLATCHGASSTDDLDHLAPILIAIAVGTVIGVVGAQRVQMTQMPQLVALFNGVGGGAAALVALLELHEIVEVVGRSSTCRRSTWPRRRSPSWSASVSFSGSMVTFAKLQELMTTRPVIFPGLPIAFGGSIARGGRLCRCVWSPTRRCGSGVVLASARAACSVCCWCCRSAAPTCRS